MTAVAPTPPVTPNTDSPLKLGNSAMRAGQPQQAIAHYLAALTATPALSNSIAANITLARQKYRTQRNSAAKPRVAVCGWELSHNAAGRVYTLAMLYETFADVEIIGSHFPGWGREIWEPIRDTAIAKHSFVVEEESKFIDQAIQLVAGHPYDIVHLSKPRAPNIFFGILYKLIWDAKVLMDIDDEELAFVGAETPISVDAYITQHGKLPDMKDLAGKDWTCLAVGLAKEFDGVTVCNSPLQQRYGGEIIRHARDEKLFKPSPELKRQSREKYGIPQDKKVVLFFGTPREHKGLIETAQAIADLKRADILFCIVGDFPDLSIKERLQAIEGVSFQFISNQPIDSAPEVTSIANVCVLLQSNASIAGKFQTPAKLSDSLAMAIPVATHRTPGIADFVSAEAVFSFECAEIGSQLQEFLRQNVNQSNDRGHKFFLEELSVRVNAQRLRSIFIDLFKLESPASFRVNPCDALIDKSEFKKLLIGNSAPSSLKWARHVWPSKGEIIDGFSTPKAIAFYLPQYHPTLENDANWGSGFTDWTNVVKAQPRFNGHYQPRLPGELGLYDLREDEVLSAQAKLAKEHGLAGFCFYYYRFGNRRVLHLPVENYLESRRLELPFCYCWANESWTRAWDGKTSDVLLQQDYDETTVTGFADDVASAVQDERYIRIRGRPLILIYQVAEIPQAEAVVAHIKSTVLKSCGFEPLLGTVFSPRFTPALLDFLDFVVQFPPHRIPRRGERVLLQGADIGPYEPEREDHYESYDQVASDSIAGMSASTKMFAGVCPDWDNSARRQKNATTLIGATPVKFERWVEQAGRLAVKSYKAGGTPAPMIFINAWNEWAEGAALEPCKRFGRQYIQALRMGLEASRHQSLRQRSTSPH